MIRQDAINTAVRNLRRHWPETMRSVAEHGWSGKEGLKGVELEMRRQIRSEFRQIMRAT